MEYLDLISKLVSFQPSAWGTIEKEVAIAEVIKDIKRGKYANEINILRGFLKNGEKDKYDVNKKRLPGVTFCGNFSNTRKRESLKTYHSIIVLDIDKLDKTELSRVKAILKHEKYVFTHWLSPSEKGYKGLVYFKYKFDIDQFGVDIVHKWAFEQISEYFLSNYSIELDNSGSDTTRLCFLSYDPELVFKTDIFPFFVNQNELEPISTLKKVKKEKNTENKLKSSNSISRNVLKNPKGKNNQNDKRNIIKIIKYLKNNNLSITETYDDWYRVSYAIANTFTHDIGEKFFLSLCEMDGVNHNEVQSRNILLYCYQTSKSKIGFSTITYMAKKKGFKI